MLSRFLKNWLLVSPIVLILLTFLLYWELFGFESEVNCYAETPLGVERLNGICNVRTHGVGWQHEF